MGAEEAARRQTSHFVLHFLDFFPTNPAGALLMKSSHVRVFLLVVFAALVLTSLAFTALQSPRVQGKLLAGLVHRLETFSGYSLKFDTHRWNPLSRITLYNVVATGETKEVFRVREAEVHYAFSPLSLGVRVRRVLLDHPVLLVQKNDRGRWIPPAAKGRSVGSSMEEKKIRRLNWKGATVSILSGVVMGLDENDGVIFKTGFSGEIRLENVIEGDLGRLFFNVESLNGEHAGLGSG